MPRLRAVLVDVGGTLWPDRTRVRESPERAIARLAEVLPGTSEGLLERLHARLEETVTAFSGELVQDTDRVVREVASQMRLNLDGAVVARLRRAMNEPAAGLVSMFEGAGGFLETLRALALRTVIVSNAYWRDVECYRRDLEDMGVAALVDGIVSSVDLGRRKPHRAMFDAGLELAGCAAAEAVMVGNMEEKDILPALALGMRAVRVSIAAEGPVVSAAGAVATSLEEAGAVVRSWVEAG